MTLTCIECTQPMEYGQSCPQCGRDYREECRLVNLTPHAIHIVDDSGSPLLTLPPSGSVARCATAREFNRLLSIGGVVISQTHTGFGEIEGLPCSVTGIFYIVSALVAQAARDRDDLLIPDDTVRDNEGRIMGCRALARI